ncbi:MAG: glucosaminidase domain-containing protein [Bacteroidaceae bacterium]|nr:glucosaminidase domain-containing protein [Bacteroidaceae bacterium]
MNNRFITILSTALLLAASLLSFAQSPSSIYQSYITQYAPTAQAQMQRYGIPASITLAQALLESAAGQSYLANKANNHFGIKVTTDWTGPYVVKDDDKPNEKFRAYNSPSESYEDHSKFLKRSRYQPLASLPVDDYKGWAHGLKACGYATNPTYAEKLIRLIEQYDLHQYDHPVGNVSSSSNVFDQAKNVTPQHVRYNSIYDLVRFCNGSRYIIAENGDTWKSLARVYGLSERKLRHINEYPAGYQPTHGCPIYLDKKHSRAAKSLKGKTHIVRAEESMHSISQMYGIRMKTLYKLNHLLADYHPRPGDVLLLR